MTLFETFDFAPSQPRHDDAVRCPRCHHTNLMMSAILRLGQSKKGTWAPIIPDDLDADSVLKNSASQFTCCDCGWTGGKEHLSLSH